MKGKYMLASLAMAALLAAGCGSKPAETTTPTSVAAPVQQGESKAPATTASGTQYVAAEGSAASYAVGETFLGQDRNVTAVGTTGAVTGEIVLDGGVIKPSTVQVDLSTLKSDESRRDNRVRQALDTGTHQFATFAITGAEGNPVLNEGEEVALKLQGSMTIKGKAKPLVFDAKAKVSGDTLSLTATTTFNMTDFGVNPPNIANFVAVKEAVKLDVTFVGKR